MTLRKNTVSSTERPTSTKSSSKRRRRGLDLLAGDSDVNAQFQQKEPAASSSVRDTTIISVHSAESSVAPLPSSTLQWHGPSKRQKLEPKHEGPRRGPLPLDGVPCSASPAEWSVIVAKAHAEIAKLKDEAVEKNKLCSQIELRAKQDMMLDILRERDKTTRCENTLQKERRQVRTLLETHRKQIIDLEHNATIQQNRVLVAQAEVKSWRSEVEHYQNLTAGLESDMEELRKLNDEDRARQTDLAKGLPPPFGSIDDPDHLPPWDRHKDSGPVLMSTAKRRIRAQLDRAAAASLARSVKVAHSVGSSRANAEVMSTMTQCLHATSQTLKRLLHHAEDIRAIQITDNQKRTLEYLRSHVAANQIVEILLDALWRTASIADIRPTTPTFSLRDKAEMGTIFSAADDTLLSALQATFSTHRSLHHLQRRLTQLTALRTEFFKWRLDPQSLFFGNSHLWLSEQVEKEREMAASANVDWRALAKEDKASASQAWEVLSSVWEGSEKCSVRGSMEPDEGVGMDAAEPQRAGVSAQGVVMELQGVWADFA